MRIVLDTNVLVSGLLSPQGPPGRIVQMVASGILTVCYDGRILTEYSRVCRRPKFGFDPEPVRVLLGLIEAEGVLVSTEPLRQRLPDGDDEPYLDVALAAGTECLITGNLRDYPKRCRQGMTVLSPREFIEYFREHG